MMSGMWRRWSDDDRGASAVEFALLLPILLTLLLGTITIFDLFRTAQSAEKATFTVGDMVSRQTVATNAVLGDKLTFINKTVDFSGQARLRVSSISNVNGKLTIDWTWPTTSIGNDIARVNFDFVPQMAVGDSVILTETFISHQALVSSFGFDKVLFSNRSVTRPRFVGKIVYQ